MPAMIFVVKTGQTAQYGQRYRRTILTARYTGIICNGYQALFSQYKQCVDGYIPNGRAVRSNGAGNSDHSEHAKDTGLVTWRCSSNACRHHAGRNYSAEQLHGVLLLEATKR